MTATEACPKHMEYGPCGGVLADGGCELGDRRCSFVDLPTVRWSGIDRAGAPDRPEALTGAAERMRALLAERPVLVADLPTRALSTESITEVGAVLAGRVDAVLAGDSGTARVQFPPAYRAALLQRAGLTVWSGVNCRDRNRVALEGELAALADVGVAGVHCVTGDHTASGARPDAGPVFDLDATELASLARAAAHLVSVAAAPASPPRAGRADRLAQKVAAGADVCFVDHCGGVGPASAFRAEARELGLEVPMIACVPLVVDAASAALLLGFPNLQVPDGFLRRIESASDARAAGIDATAALAAAFLDAGFDGVDLSGGPGPGGETAYADAIAEVAARLALP